MHLAFILTQPHKLSSLLDLAQLSAAFGQQVSLLSTVMLSAEQAHACAELNIVLVLRDHTTNQWPARAHSLLRQADRVITL